MRADARRADHARHHARARDDAHAQLALQHRERVPLPRDAVACRGCVAALHPGTNVTRLSEPFLANVSPENRFKPSDTAAHFLDLLTGLEPHQSGRFWAWDGSNIPW